MTPPLKDGPRLYFGNNEPIKNDKIQPYQFHLVTYYLCMQTEGKSLIPFVASRTQLILISWKKQKKEKKNRDVVSFFLSNT